MSGPADTDPTRGAWPGAVGRPVDRRHFLRTGLAAGIAVTASCGNPFGDDDDRGSSRLRTRLAGPRLTIAPGVHDLFPDTGVEGGLCVPSDYDPNVPVPLIVMLHGAGSSRDVIDNLFPLTETRGMLMVTPRSQRTTWDMVRNRFGPDVKRLDRVLAYTFERCAVDPTAVVLAGFSDGGTYALSLGLDNGDLFTHIIAYSPGFLAPLRPRGEPRIYIAHGTNDTVLPIAQTSRVIVPLLMDMGYEVTYNEFEGIHAVYLSIVSESFVWVRPERPEVDADA